MQNIKNDTLFSSTRNRVFVKGYGFLSFVKNMDKKYWKNISKNLSGKYSQELLYHPKQSAIDALKSTSRKVIQEQQKRLVT